MAQFIMFFPRQVVQGNSASSATIYSDVFDVSEVSNMEAELSVYALSGTSPSCTGTIEETEDPSFDSWSSYGSVNRSTSGTSTGTFSNPPRRFIRGKLEVSTADILTVKFTARGFC